MHVRGGGSDSGCVPKILAGFEEMLYVGQPWTRPDACPLGLPASIDPLRSTRFDRRTRPAVGASHTTIGESRGGAVQDRCVFRSGGGVSHPSWFSPPLHGGPVGRPRHPQAKWTSGHLNCVHHRNVFRKWRLSTKIKAPANRGRLKTADRLDYLVVESVFLSSRFLLDTEMLFIHGGRT